MHGCTLIAWVIRVCFYLKLKVCAYQECACLQRIRKRQLCKHLAVCCSFKNIRAVVHCQRIFSAVLTKQRCHLILGCNIGDCFVGTACYLSAEHLLHQRLCAVAADICYTAVFNISLQLRHIFLAHIGRIAHYKHFCLTPLLRVEAGIHTVRYMCSLQRFADIDAAVKVRYSSADVLALRDVHGRHLLIVLAVQIEVYAYIRAGLAL